jgi:hypothetical protein
MKILFRSALVAAGLVIASAGTASAQLTTTMKFTTKPGQCKRTRVAGSGL